MSAIAASQAPTRAPLFLLAGCHGALHWVLGSFYVLLPFIQIHLGLSYAETGLLASTVHLTSLVVNVPSGMAVDITGKRIAFALTALVLASAGMAGLSTATGLTTVVLAVSVVAAMNTLWHPAAISYLSAQYPTERGRALSYHTVGASVGDALAPIAVGASVTLIGWQSSAWVAAFPAAVAAVILWFYFSNPSDTTRPGGSGQRRAVTDYRRDLASILRDSRVWGVCLMAGLRGTCQVGLRAFLPLYAVNEMGADGIWVGIIIFAFQGAGVIGTPVAGSVSDRLGRRPVLVVGLLLSGVLVALMPSVSEPWLYLAVVALTGASLLSLRPVVQGWALDLTPPALGGSTITLVFGVQAAFAMTVPVLSGMAADRWGLSMAFYMFAGAAAAAAAMAMVLTSARNEA
jgi:MFS family permease